MTIDFSILAPFFISFPYRYRAQTVLFFLFASLTAFCYAQSIPHPYEFAKFERLHATLQQPSSQVIDNLTLRQALEGLAFSLNTPVWLDRRVDGELIVKLEPGTRSHLQTLDELCRQGGAEVAWLENITYIAPARQASRIEMAYWQLFTSPSQGLWRKSQPNLTWKSSREIFPIADELARRTNLSFEYRSALQLDRWRAGTLPAASLAVQWTLFLAGFDLSLNTSNKRVIVEPTPVSRAVRFEYGSVIRSAAPSDLQRWKEEYPTAKVTKTKQGTWIVEASVAGHRDLWLAITNSRPQPRIVAPTLDEARYKLEVKGEFGKTFPVIAKQLGLELNPWPLPKSIMESRIERQFDNASLDEMLDEIARQAKVELKRSGKKIEIVVP